MPADQSRRLHHANYVADGTRSPLTNQLHQQAKSSAHKLAGSLGCFCQILRSDRHWQRLPVMFLSVHQDEQTQNRAFDIGADDYVCRPKT